MARLTRAKKSVKFGAEKTLVRELGDRQHVEAFKIVSRICRT